MNTFEVNFDGLVGPSHHYAGLSKGNIASEKNAMGAANPRAAAIQGLKKMKTLADMGFKQGFLAPHLRPNIEILKKLGFTGSRQQIIERAWRDAPEIVSKCYSASPMWTANAATVSPAADTQDGKTHFTAANLCRMFHRSYESDFTSKLLAKVFSNPEHFVHHAALPSGFYFGDEGAANHSRFAQSHASPGVEFFVYGESAFDKSAPKPSKYTARQSLEASQAIARLHGLESASTVFAQQNPAVIDRGVFHNDVIAVGTTSLLFYHQLAFLNSEQVIAEIKDKYKGDNFYALEVLESEVSLNDAVQTYLFNTQLIDLGSTDNGEANFLLIAPSECEENENVRAYLESVVASNAPISKIEYFNLRESMKNGGGPACLRLRVALSTEEISSIQPRVMMNDDLYTDLIDWVNKHYRDRLTFEDLKDPELITELQNAALALETIINIPNLYNL